MYNIIVLILKTDGIILRSKSQDNMKEIRPPQGFSDIVPTQITVFLSSLNIGNHFTTADMRPSGKIALEARMAIKRDPTLLNDPLPKIGCIFLKKRQKSRGQPNVWEKEDDPRNHINQITHENPTPAFCRRCVVFRHGDLCVMLEAAQKEAGIR